MSKASVSVERVVGWAGLKGDADTWREAIRRWWPRAVEWLASAIAGAGAWIMANPGVALLVAAGVLLVVRLCLPGILARRHAGDKKAVSVQTAMVDRRTGDPAVGWMRFYEAVRLAEEYALPLKEITSKEAATQLVEEFVERHRDHYDERTRFVERRPLVIWLLRHRIPMPHRWRWRRKAFGFGRDDKGRIFVVPSEKRRPLGDDE